jgi:two-component system KDP operon response regulator KdpE
MTRVLVVEPERYARVARAHGLAPDFQAIEAEDALEAVRRMFERRPDAAIVNFETPGLSGPDLLNVIRAACDIPVLVVGSDPDGDVAAEALDAGADDFVLAQAPAVELRARLRAALRRHRRDQTAGPDRVVRTGDLVIDRQARLVYRSGEAVNLTPTEFRLIDALASMAGDVASHSYLLGAVWGPEYVDDSQYLRAYIGMLRSKLEERPRAPRYLRNEWGVGYRLAVLPTTTNGSGTPAAGDALAVAD